MENYLRHAKYSYAKPFGNPKHDWSLIGPTMAVNFHVTQVNGYSDSAGLEFHYFNPPTYMKSDPPSHVDCPLTGGRCWHDGTSLYATETLWPMIFPMMRSGDHDAIFAILSTEMEKRHKDREGE